MYFVICGAIAVWATRRTHDAADFFVAGGTIGVWTLAISAMAATLSGFIFIGGPGLLYGNGIGALFISLSASITTPLSAWALAKRLRLLREVRGVLTVPDAVGARYRSPAAQGLAAVAILVATIGYVATNFLALGFVVDAIFHTGLRLGRAGRRGRGGGVHHLGWDPGRGVHRSLPGGGQDGGLGAGVCRRAARGAGTRRHLAHAILAHQPAFLGPWGTMPPLAALSLFVVFGLGTLGQPHVIRKYYMLRDPRQLRWYPLLMTVVLVLTLLLFFGVGHRRQGRRASGHDGAAGRARRRHAGIPAARRRAAAGRYSVQRDCGGDHGHGQQLHERRRRGGDARPAGGAGAAAAATSCGRDGSPRWRSRRSRRQWRSPAACWWRFSGSSAGDCSPRRWCRRSRSGYNWTGGTAAGAIASIAVGLGGTLLFESLAYFRVYSFPAGVTASGLMLVVALLTFVVVSWATRRHAAADLPADIRRIMEV